MKGNIKIAVIGAGSTYSPEIIEGLLDRRETLPAMRICFMDINQQKLDVLAGLAGRMLDGSGIGFQVTTNLEEAVQGADYVLAQIRAGGLEARIRDEKLPLKHGFVGQETTGIGGFMNALRTIPKVLDIAGAIERLAPDAWFINFSNPSGILAQTVLDHTRVKTMGLCNGPINMLASVGKHLADGKPFDYTYVGLNHLSWITSVVADGKELLSPEVLGQQGVTGMKNIPDLPFPPALLRAVGGIPSSYLGYYYLRDQHYQKCKDAERSRGEICRDIEEALLQKYTDPALKVKPEELAQRGGALYSTAAVNLVHAIENDTCNEQVVNIRNQGALPFMEAGDVVEIKAQVGQSGAQPVPVSGFHNTHIIGLMRAVKAYEKLTVKAGREGDLDAALAALVTHPMIGDFPRAKAALEEMLEANRADLPQFYPQKS